MELGPRDRLSQAFWYEEQKGRTVSTPLGQVVLLDLRHLGAAKIHERLPLITEVAKTFMGIDPVVSPIPVRPAVHYSMGGIPCNVHAETPLKGLYAAGECSSVGIHGANRLGSNSLSELVVFGKVAGDRAAQYAKAAPAPRPGAAAAQADAVEKRLLGLLGRDKGDRFATIRDEMHRAMDTGVGIFRKADTMQAACASLARLRDRYRSGLKLDDRNRAFNTEWLSAIELGFTLELAEVIAQSALHRRESRGAHTRLDEFKERDDANYLKHTLAYRTGDGPPRIEYAPVTITKSPPKTRVYGGEGKKAELT
jgi:fumarate reductase flavoprotein subunit